MASTNGRSLPEPRPEFQVAASDPVTQTWLPLPNPYTVEDARTWCLDRAPAVRSSGRGLVRAIEADGCLVGSIDLKRTDWVSRVTEIGYWVSPTARGRGVMTEATQILARWVLDDMGFARVELRIAPENVASLRVAEKAGFVREGVARVRRAMCIAAVSTWSCSRSSAKTSA